MDKTMQIRKNLHSIGFFSACVTFHITEKPPTIKITKNGDNMREYTLVDASKKEMDRNTNSTNEAENNRDDAATTISIERQLMSFKWSLQKISNWAIIRPASSPQKAGHTHTGRAMGARNLDKLAKILPR